MNRSAIILATIVAAGAAVPAFAAWDRIGSVDFSRRDTHEVRYGNFGGPIEALALQARGADLDCRSVTATFGNGNTREVFSGELREGRNVTVDLPGAERRVERLDFDCEPLDRARAQVDIAVDVNVDVGRYRDDWRKSPDWDRVWSGILGNLTDR